MSIDRHRNGNKYFDVLEVNISNIGREPAKQSYDHFSLHSSGLSNVNIDNKMFISSRDVAALNIGGLALTENKVLKHWSFIP